MEILVYGYLRQSEMSLTDIIPPEIPDICFKYHEDQLCKDKNMATFKKMLTNPGKYLDITDVVQLTVCDYRCDICNSW